MSFYYSVIMDDRIAMLTDGASISAKGLLVEVASKVVTNQNPPFAITGRGNSTIIDALAKMIRIGCERCDTFEDVICLIDHTLKGIQKQMDPYPAVGHFELLIAGWGKDGPLHLYVSSFTPRLEGGEADKQPFKLYVGPWEIGGGPQVTLEEMAAAGLTREKAEAAGRDVLEIYGADIVEIARCKKGSDDTRPEIGEFYGIGGFVELTTIRPDGVETKKLREWDDEIGSPLNPLA